MCDASDLRLFVKEVDWEGKDESWDAAVIESLADNDIKACGGMLRICMCCCVVSPFAGPAPVAEDQIWGCDLGCRHVGWKESFRGGLQCLWVNFSVGCMRYVPVQEV